MRSAQSTANKSVASVVTALMQASLEAVDNKEAAAEALSAMRKKNQILNNAKQQPERVVDKRQIDMFDGDVK